MLKGIDVSWCQGRNVDWAALKASGIEFEFSKSSEGVTGTDPTFKNNAKMALDLDMISGAYHVIRPGNPEAQAIHFYENTKDAGLLLPPVMDWEPLNSTGTLFAPVNDAIIFIQKTEDLWQKPCIIYTYPSFFKYTLKNPSDKFWTARALWIAHYGVSSPTIPGGWKKWTIWQYDGNGGELMPDKGDADFNWYDGTKDELLKFCGCLQFGEESGKVTEESFPIKGA